VHQTIQRHQADSEISFMKQLQDFILTVPNVLAADLRAKILQEYADSDEWEASRVGNTPVVDKTYRDVSEICVSKQEIIQKNIVARAEIDKDLFACAGFVLVEYQKAFAEFTKVHIENDEGYKLLRYEANQFYVEHTDDIKQQPRTVSCSFALNDDYDGGEWSFFGGAYTTRLNAGDAILFPSTFLYPHSIRPVLEGTRYSVITWFR
jgi:predicted 2-oxoglutarate/Fe(II)-dependent dioxygenase YbiX